MVLNSQKEVIFSCFKAGMSNACFKFSWENIDYLQEALENFKMGVKRTKDLALLGLEGNRQKLLEEN